MLFVYHPIFLLRQRFPGAILLKKIQPKKQLKLDQGNSNKLHMYKAVKVPLNKGYIFFIRKVINETKMYQKLNTIVTAYY